MNARSTPLRILVATDLSDPTAGAVVQAHLQARSVDGALGVCHVLPSSKFHILFPRRFAREAADEAELNERVVAIVGETVTSTTGRPPGSFEVFVEHGTDYAEIVRRAEVWRATQVVVGGHGRTGAARGVLAGVAEKVVRYAHCPVFVARPPAHRGLVICATDLSAPSLPAVVAAVAEARVRNAKLVVLHIVDQGVPLASVAPSMGISPLLLSPEMLHYLRETARAEIEAVLSKLEARAELMIVEGHAAPEILKYIEDHRPELVVVGARGRTGLARIVLGSVAEHIVRVSKASVLVVRVHP
jgi:nucleotide-binding universal stress UspA family protein